MTLNPDILLQIIFNANKRNEILLLESILKWIQFNLNNYSYRTGIHLLNEIRFNEIDSAQLKFIYNENTFILQINELQKYFQLKIK